MTNELVNYHLCCDEETHHIMLADIPVQDINDSLISFIWENPGSKFCWDHFKSLSDILIDALIRGWKGDAALTLAYENTSNIHIEYNSPDWTALAAMKANIFKFSAAATIDKAIELNRQLPGCKTFADFKKKADTVINDKYPVNHLRTEYNFAYRTSQMAADYHRFVSMKQDYPSWQYKTQGDSRVREAHRRLDGMIFKADDPVFNIIWTPNGWGCRCYIKPLLTVPEEYNTQEQAITELQQSNVDSKGQSEYDRMVKGGFDTNPAKTNVIFNKNMLYIQGFDKGFGVKDMYGHEKYKMKNINQAELTEFTADIKSNESAINWFNAEKKQDGYALFVDYSNLPVRLSEETVRKHLTDKAGYSDRHELINKIPDILKAPDEVWLKSNTADNKHADENAYTLNYFKFYKGFHYMIVTTVENGMPVRIKTFMKINNDSDRNGWLIKSYNEKTD